MTHLVRHSARASAALFVGSWFVAAPVGVAQSLRWERFGTSSLDEFGAAVAAAGDVDADGFQDVIVGSPRARAGGVARGIATVVSGRDGSVILSLAGRVNGEWFGHAVGAAGDLDGDGHADVFVSAPNRAAGGANLAGNVTIFAGSDGRELLAWNGSLGERFGWSVARLGDVDGDGHLEFVVGAPRHSASGVDRGRVHVVSTAGGPAVTVLAGEAAGDWFGVTVAACGDMDGDGVRDFAVGADRHDRVQLDYGRVYVYSLDARLVATFDGAAPGDRFGAAIAGLADFNGDGRADLLVGAPQHDTAGSNAGRASIVSVGLATALLDLDGDAAGDQFGSALENVGDFDCDGSEDFAIGAWANDAGGVDSGKVSVRSGFGGGELFTLLGAANGERFGIAVAGAGDVDASGCADVIVGASFNARNGPQTGRAAVFASQFVAHREPELTSVTPRRGEHRDTTEVVLKGNEFLAGGATVSAGADAASTVVVVDDETITCAIPPGEPGPVDITVQTDFGSATLVGGFVRTPALLVEGTPAIGQQLGVRYLCEPGDLVLGFFGLPPAQRIRVGPLDHYLAIRPFVVHLATKASGDEILEIETIPDDASLVGVEFLMQGIAKQRGSKRGSFTNVVSIKIE